MDEKLFQEFPPVTTEAWEEVIKKDLKGADYDKKLVWKTIEGFSVKPYFRSEDLNDLDYLVSNPAEFPFVRGTKIDNNWEIRQDITVNDVKKANELSHKLIAGGVTSIGFTLPIELSKNDFELLLKGINLEEIAVNFNPATMSEVYVDYLVEYVKANKINPDLVKGANNFDPLAYMLTNGEYLCGGETCNCAENMFSKLVGVLPNYKLININARHFNNAGGSIVQELAFGLAMGAEYLNKLIGKGVSIDNITPRIQFNFAVGSNYFMEIAKLRAAKLLWAKIVEANNPENIDSTKIYIHSETSMWNKTVYDPHVNMLRVTTEAMSAVIGGTDSLNVNPFDATYTEPTEFSLRIARNVQMLIKEEAHFDKVSDPSAGSYYIENLTNTIVENVWNLFLEVEEKGGFIAAIEQGFIQDKIEATAQKRDKNIETRNEILLGTNQYPNFGEVLKCEDSNCKCKCTSSCESNTTYRPIKLYRGSQAFEELRLKTDQQAKRPVVFMLTIGNLAFRKARAQFSSNFFACAGFETIDNNGFETIAEGLKVAKEKNADIIVLCSSDEEYAAYAPELQAAKDKEIVVIAGNPACKEELESKGIVNFVHVKSNVLEDLKKYQIQLGIN